MIKGITVNKESQEDFEEKIAKIEQEEKEWFEMIEKERQEFEKDPTVLVKKSELKKLQEQNISLKEENASLRMQLAQSTAFFRELYSKMIEATKQKEITKPRMIGNIKLYE